MFSRFRTSLACAGRGVKYVWESQPNFRIQVFVAVFILMAISILKFSFVETGFILFAISMVLTGELLNTIVEDILDIVQPLHAAHIGRLKDIAAGAVLLLSSVAALIGIATFIYHFTTTVNLPV